MQARCRYASKYKGLRMPKCDCLACWSIYSHALKVRKLEAALQRALDRLNKAYERAEENRKSVLRGNLTR